jgi:hypothetical protein
MIGPVLLTIFLLVMFPIGISLSGALVAALHGALGTKDADERHEGSELVALSRQPHR